MKKFYVLTLAALILTSSYAFSQNLAAKHQKEADRAKLVNKRIDNNGYWMRMAARGLATLNPVVPVKPAVYTGSEIRAFSVITEDSPDVPVADESSTQSENSVFIDPVNNQVALNSNNSTPNPVSYIYGANSLETVDGGLNWEGSVDGAGGSNSGDPVALIGRDGAYYIGAISNPGGQQVSVSNDQGTTYSVHYVANSGGGPNDLLDKNHLWIDNCISSPYANNLYDAWTLFQQGSANEGDIFLSRSTNGGANWSNPLNISNSVINGDFCQGTNINSGPNGEVYVIWAVYTYLPDESGIGMTRSFDGGVTFEPAHRAIDNIRGIRSTGVVKDMRNNSFPSMTVDVSGGPYNGNIYIVWPNVGVPGINSDGDVDVYMIRSSDQGLTFSAPIRINQDPTGLGKKHYFPWIVCDPANGVLSVIFYDDRNVGAYDCEVYCANSEDGGDTWEDFKVSDVSFTPSPIPGLAGGYMGDYLGISARDGWVYPTWTDNRTGTAMTYCSPYETNPLSRPKNLTAQVTFETGITNLKWSFENMEGFSYFKIYRNLDSVAVAYDTVYNDQLPDYGIYSYTVTAKYSNGKESSAVNASVQWGDAHISVNPMEVVANLLPDSSVTKMVTINNIGQLEMNYSISMFIPTKKEADSRFYCFATGGCDEYISRVQLNEIDNPSACTEYGDYTSLTTTMSVGNSYLITVTNGVPTYSNDQCAVWVDWNQNEVFDDNEMITMNGSPGVGPYTGEITPPVGAMPGITRLRARIVYYQTPIPCETTSYGEVEDYSVDVVSWLVASPVEGTVPAGESVDVAVTMSAVDLALGTYTAELNVFSNDPDIPEVTVPLTMNIVEIAVNLNADATSICLGNSTHITSQVVGGSGNFTYTWTSNPAGFNSGDHDITVSPEVTTTYYLEIFDGILTTSDSVTIQVNPLPTVYVGADISICIGDTLTINAGAGFTSYLWNTGETTESIKATESGSYSVVVTNEFGCTGSDAMELAVFQMPAKPVIGSGPSSVDNYITTSSDYTCGTVPNAVSFQWTVTPAEAGTTSSTGTSAEFVWTTGFTGSVTINVVAVNECFNSEISDSFATTVYSSAGLDENSADHQLIIYPNPTTGKITVSLPSQKSFTGDLTVTDAAGSKVYSQTGIMIPAGSVSTFDLGQIAEGIYSLKLSSQSMVYYGKVIIK